MKKPFVILPMFEVLGRFNGYRDIPRFNLIAILTNTRVTGMMQFTKRYIYNCLKMRQSIWIGKL